MDKMNIDHHISQQFNVELEELRNNVLNMGGMVEKQLDDAMNALIDYNSSLGEVVITNDYKVNAMEVTIDEECSRILARRQPTAGDLRLIVAIIKTITDLERIGDEAEKIAQMAVHLSGIDDKKRPLDSLQHMGDTVKKMLHNALDSFARLDIELAIETAKRDAKVDNEYEGISRQVITFMMEDPRIITHSLDVMWSARALERIGDHARNICEYLIYLVKGRDVRHTSFEQMEQAARKPR